MAHKSYTNSRFYSGHVFPVLLDVSVPIGASGAVGTIAGPYIKSVSHLGTGLYQIQMSGNYNNYYFGQAIMISPVTGSALAIDSVSAALTVGSPYQITVVGNNTLAAWQAIGLPVGLTPAVGMSFVATATGSGASGTGRVKAIGASGIMNIELLSNPQLSASPFVQPGQSGAVQGQQGAIIQLQTLATSGSPADPASGSLMKIFFCMSNSSVQIGGE